MKKTLFLAVLFSINSNFLFSQRIERIWGVIIDNANQTRIPGAEISVVGFNQTTKTDSLGNFTLYLENPLTVIEVRIYKTTYQNLHRNVTLPLNAPLDIRLTRQNETPTIVIDTAIVGNRINGRITGMSNEMIGQYKVVVYFLTDKYYIHPYPETYQGPVSNIVNNGTWQISSVRHPSPCPLRVLAAIVRRDYVPQSIIYGPQNDFINWIECNSCINCK